MKKLILVFILLAIATSFAVNNFAICPDHGVKSAFTGNKKSVVARGGKMQIVVWYCEYSHPLDKGGLHKFWQPCE